MTVASSIADFSPEQWELWGRVMDLWASSQSRDSQKVESALHPDYVGWDMNAPSPHDRMAAVLSVSGDSPRLQTYALEPRSVRIYDHRVGVVHYSYAATVVPRGADSITITGKWTEVYLRQDGVWRMIAVGGKPDLQQVDR